MKRVIIRWVEMTESERKELLIKVGINADESEEYAEVNWYTLPKNIRNILINNDRVT
jgi:hypothetical protein